MYFSSRTKLPAKPLGIFTRPSEHHKNCPKILETVGDYTDNSLPSISNHDSVVCMVCNVGAAKPAPLQKSRNLLMSVSVDASVSSSLLPVRQFVPSQQHCACICWSI